MQICVIYENSTIRRFKYEQMNKYNEYMESIAKYINKDNKLEDMTVFAIGSLLYVNEKVYAADPMAKIDTTGNKLLNIIRHVGYWICVVCCIIDIIKSLMQGDTKSIGKTMIKYALAFAALFVFPWMLDTIKETFAR